MDPLTVSSTTWRGMSAQRIAGSRLEVVVTTVGAHLAVLRSIGDEVNPLWQPTWPASDPALVVAGPHSPYGTSAAEAPLLATIVGSNLSLHRFGAPWPGEEVPMHGEAGVVTWSAAMISSDLIEFAATLPKARLRVRRRVQIDGDTLVLATAVAHDDAQPREVEWCEHTTLGAPFIDGATVTAGVDRVINWPLRIDPDSRFAASAPESDIPVAEALAIPAPDASPCGDVLTGRVAEGWWRIENRRLGRCLSAAFNRDDFPWLALWTQHRSRQQAPWLGRERTRGMEMSTKPFPEGKPPASRATAYQDRPSVCVVPPGGWKEHVVRFAWQRL